jgi:hypothetical protein
LLGLVTKLRRASTDIKPLLVLPKPEHQRWRRRKRWARFWRVETYTWNRNYSIRNKIKRQTKNEAIKVVINQKHASRTLWRRFDNQTPAIPTGW